MAAHKGDTPEKILRAAQEIFLRDGFQSASVQQIARAVGISAPGLYKHFDGKEAIFSALADPVISGISRLLHAAEQEKDTLFAGDQTDAVWDKTKAYAQLLDFVYQHFGQVKLVVCCAEGTRYAGALDQLADAEAHILLRTLPALREKGMQIPALDEETVLLMMRSQYRACAEFIRRGFSRERAESYLQTVSGFFTAGWRALLGF